MIAYIVIGTLTCFLAYLTTYMKSGKTQVAFVMLSSLPCSILAAFRYDIGPDYGLYKRIFDSIRATGNFFSVKSLEPGYAFINHAVLFFGGNYQVVLFAVAWIISTMFFLGALRLSTNYVLSVSLFFAMGFYCDSFNGLRQYIAAAITFCALSYVAKGERWKAVLLCLVAFLFHQSAIIMLPVCLMVNKVTLTSWKAIGITVLIAIFGNYLYEALTNLLAYTRYAYYLGSVEYAVEPTLGTTVLTTALTIAALAVGVYSNSIEVSDEHSVMTNMNILALLSAVLSFFVPLALRVQYYFVPFEIVFFPYILTFVKNHNARFLLASLLFLMFLGMTVIGMVFNGWYGAYPYQMVR